MVAAAAFALTVVAGAAFATIPGSDGVVSGCYEKRTGNLRVIDAEAGRKCLSVETPISWNQRGERGATGDAGTRWSKRRRRSCRAAGASRPRRAGIALGTRQHRLHDRRRDAGTVDVTIAADGTVGFRCTATPPW